MTATLIALFIATQHPTQRNCAVLRDALIDVSAEEAFRNKRETLRKDALAIKLFVTKTCKDGVKRK